MATSSASASSTKAIIILILVGLLVFTLPTVLVLITGMVPSFIAYATDRRREKYKTLSVGCMNLLGVLPLLTGLWTKDHSFDMAFSLFADPFNWLIVLGSAATGWTIFLIAPSFVAMFLSARIELSVDRLKRRQNKLIEEWGDGVSGNNESRVTTEQDE
ncbi:MAG: acyl-CoA synthetase [Thalassobaculaceae bacterium]